jgi:hypothetical protein
MVITGADLAGAGTGEVDTEAVICFVMEVVRSNSGLTGNVRKQNS